MKIRSYIFAANEADAPEGLFGPFVSFAVNEANGEQWVQLSPFGSFPNQVGLQIVTPEDCKSVVNEFNQIFSVPRKVMGLPWYVGHPDHPSFRQFYNDTSAKGRIHALQCRHDPNCDACNSFMAGDATEPCPDHGLFANTKWNSEGKKLIADQAYQGHSVNWKLQRRTDGWHPVLLKSVGFTNEPNIPVPAILAANTKGQMTPKKSLMGYVNEMLGTSYPEDDKGYEEAANSLRTMKNDHAALQASFSALKKQHDDLGAKHAEMTNAMAEISKKFGSNEAVAPVLTDLATVGVQVPAEGVVVFMANAIKEKDAVAKKVAEAEQTAQAANAKVTTLTGMLTTVRAAAAKALGHLALTGGFVTKPEHEKLVADAANETTFGAAAERVLAMKQPKYSTRSQVGTLGTVSGAVMSSAALQGELADMANETMRKHNSPENGKAPHRPMSYTDAWAKAKASPRGKEILALMESAKAAKATA